MLGKPTCLARGLMVTLTSLKVDGFQLYFFLRVWFCSISQVRFISLPEPACPLCSSVILNWGNFTFQGTLDNVWIHFCFS